MNTYSGAWFLANLVIAVGWILLGAGAVVAIGMDGKGVGWLRAVVFGGAAAVGLALCLFGAMSKVFLMRAEDEDKEYRRVLRERG